jgi:hypothetical protein
MIIAVSPKRRASEKMEKSAGVLFFRFPKSWRRAVRAATFASTRHRQRHRQPTPKKREAKPLAKPYRMPFSLIAAPHPLITTR